MHLRVMSYNIKSGRFRPDSLEAVAQLIAAQLPDVVALQEVDECLARTERIPQTDWLASRLKMYGIFAPATQIDDGWYGIALLSRWQAQKHERRLLFRPHYADADQRPRHDSEPRVMLCAVFSSFNLIVTHLGLTPDQQARQALDLVAFAKPWQVEQATVIAGDFNCEPDASELAPLREHFQEACGLVGIAGDARATFPSGPIGARCPDGWHGAIDHIWLSPQVRVTSAAVIYDETCASDHQPLVVDCEIQ